MGVAVASVLVGLPLLQPRLMQGHDTLAYLPRYVEFYEGLRHGEIFPRWAANLAVGFGDRGRPGPPSPTAALPLTLLPETPAVARVDYTATTMTARALLCYSVGLWAIAGARTIVPAFYSMQDTWTPLKIAIICLGANVVFILILIYPLKHAGLALATSLSSALNLVLLYRALRPKLGGMDMKKIMKSLLQIFLCSLAMGLSAYLICSRGDWSQVGHLGEKILLLGAGIVVGIGIYFAGSYWMKNEELFFLLKVIRKEK